MLSLLLLLRVTGRSLSLIKGYQRQSAVLRVSGACLAWCVDSAERDLFI